MAINYTCHLCQHEYEAVSDEFLEEIQKAQTVSGGQAFRYITFECPNCHESYPLDIRTLLSGD